MKIYMLFSERGWIGAYSSPEKVVANAERYMATHGTKWTKNKSVPFTWFDESLEQSLQAEECELDADCDLDDAVDVWQGSPKDRLPKRKKSAGK